MARRSTPDAHYSDALDVYPKGIDPLSYSANTAKRDIQGLVMIMSGYLPGVFASEFFRNSGNDRITILGYMALSVGAMGLCAVTEQQVRRHKYTKLLEQARAFEAEFGQPVDLVRVTEGGAPQSSTFALRWYGLDDSKRLSAKAEQAARQVAKRAGDMGIETVAIGTSWLPDHEAPDEGLHGLERYGKLINGPNALSQLNGMDKSYKVHDTLVDNQVLVTTPAKLAELLNEYTASDLERLATLLPEDVRLQELIAIARQTSDYTDLRRYVRVALERQLDEGASLYAERDETGVVQRYKTHSTARLSSGQIRRQLMVGEGAAARLVPGDTADLLRELGVSSADELIDGDEAPDRTRVLAALHIALDEEQRLRPVDSDTTHEQTGPGSLFGRMQADEESKYKLGSATGPMLRRLGAVGTLLVVGVVGSSFVGEKAREMMHDNPAPHIAAYAKAYEQYHKQANLDVERGGRDRDDFLKFLEEHYGDQAVFEKLLNDAYLDISDADARFGRWLSGPLYELYGKMPLQLDPPPSMYTTSHDNMFIGDVNIKSNQTVYTVTPLTPNAQTAGYWVGSTYDTVTTQRGTSRYPFKDGRPELGDSSLAEEFLKLSKPANPATIAEHSPDYRVETPYISPNRSISLPIKAGGSLLGARVIDASDPSWSSGPIDIWKSWSSEYEARLKAEDFVSQGVTAKQPRLEYYVKEHVDHSYRRDSPIAVESVRDTKPAQLSPEDVTRVAAATRRALGLGETATAEEIFTAISQQKKYSFTPFERAKFGGVDLSNMSDTQALEMVGQTLAELDTLNCNLATMLATLATADQEIGVRPATGFLDNGDGKLTQIESHAFFWSAEHGIRDATPGVMADGESVRGQPSAADKSDMGPVLPITGAGLVAAALAVVAYRRRQAIAEGVDTLRARAVTHLPATGRAVDLLTQAAYDKPDSRLQFHSARPAVDSQELLRRYAANIPRGGISLTEIRERARRSGQKLSWSEQLAVAAMKANDGPLRRTQQRTKANPKTQP